MKQNEIFEFMKHFEKSGLTKLEYEADGKRLLLEKVGYTAPDMTFVQPQTPQLQAQPLMGNNENTLKEEISTLKNVTSPLVGVFYEASAPGEKPFVKVGDKVQKGQILCLIEAMKMINELPCPVNGVVKSIFCINEDVVSFGQKLFEVEPC